MKITVLAGSPKGDVSVTVQYVKYIKKHFPDHEWEIINVGTGIGKLEKDPGAFDDIIKSVKSSDGVLWAFPLYFCLVCGQMKRFIELIFENTAESAFEDKYAAALTTSVHFFDHTAHNYIHAISDDLGMKYVDGFSAEMQDLRKAEGRKGLRLFIERFVRAMETRAPMTRDFDPVDTKKLKYGPGDVPEKSKSGSARITLVTDSLDSDTNIGRMIDTFVRSTPNPVEIVDLSKVEIKGGCLGCIHCSYDNKCIYHDGYREMYEEKIKSADGIIFAGAIRDRYLSSKWKVFFDRSFYNGHTPVLKGKHTAWLISGPLRQNVNLREIVEGTAHVSGVELAGIVTDEYETSEEITSRLQELADHFVRAIEKGYSKPKMFPGVGGHLLFRELVYLNLRFPFAADHRYYKKHGLYDFPQRKLKQRMIASFMSLLFKIPGIRKGIQKDMKKLMVQPYENFLKKEKMEG